MQADVFLNCNPVRTQAITGGRNLADVWKDARRERSGFVWLPAIVLIAFLTITVSAMAQEQARPFAQACATTDVAVVTLIEDHGVAGDLSADRLSKAGLTMLDARTVCSEGRVGEALALYQSILDLGPVASLRRQ